MKSIVKILTAVCVTAAVVSICGCQEQNLTDTRKVRLIASENTELKKQLEKCQADLASEKELRAKEAAESKAQAEKSQEQIKQLQGQTTEFLQQQVDSVVAALVEEAARLHQENDALTQRIKELEK